MALAVAALGAHAQFTLIAIAIDPASGQPPDTVAPGDVRIAEDGVAAKPIKVESVVRTVKVQVLIVAPTRRRDHQSFLILGGLGASAGRIV